MRLVIQRVSHASVTVYKEGHDYDNEYIEYRNEIK